MIRRYLLKSPGIDDIRINPQEAITGMGLRSEHIPLQKLAFMLPKVSSPRCLMLEYIDNVQGILVECIEI